MLLFLTLIQILLISWLGSGTRIEFMAPMVAVASLMFLCASFAKDAPKSLFFKTLSFSFFLLALMSLVAFFNPFCEMIRGEYFSTFRKLNYVSFLPTSISAEFNDGNPIRALAEIGASISVCLSCMVLFKKRKNFIITLTFFVLNATAMGVFGIWQKDAGIPMMYNLFHSSSDFFGSFFLSSAAAAFFNLALATSIALIFMLNKSTIVGKLGVVIFVVCAIVCVYSTIYTGSLGGKYLAFATLGALPFALLWKIALVRFGMRWATVAFASIIISLTCIAIVFKSEIEYKLTYVDGYKNPVGVSATSRMEMYKHTYNIISNHKIFGCGGQCSQYLLSLEMTKNTPKNQMARSTYHVHSDIIEYTAEFGIIGLLIILTTASTWIFDFVKSRPTFSRTVLMLGCVISLIHSCLDMNLHILSTMIAFGIICAATVAGKRKNKMKGIRQ